MDLYFCLKFSYFMWIFCNILTELLKIYITHKFRKEILICLPTHITIYRHIYIGVYAVVQSLSHVRLFVTPWTAAHQASLSSTISQSLLKFKYISQPVMSYFYHFPIVSSFPLPKLANQDDNNNNKNNNLLFSFQLFFNGLQIIFPSLT